MSEFEKKREELLAIYHAIGTDVKVVPVTEYNQLVEQLDQVELAEAKARMENERLRAALEFYADRDNYYQSEDDRMTGYPPEVFGDNGFTARKVLAGDSDAI